MFVHILHIDVEVLRGLAEPLRVPIIGPGAPHHNQVIAKLHRGVIDLAVGAQHLATRGLCADVMRVVLAEHQLITGDVMLTKLREVFGRRIKLPTATVDDILALLRAQEVVPKPRKPSDVLVRDPDDRWILASATAGRADVLVTGDRDLLDVADKAPLSILDPRGFWNLLSKS